jgi:transposase, IS30 family
VIRRPRGVRLPDGRGARPGILHISERPAEAEDRAVPGHGEGDLVFGKHMSPIATLVEGSTRYVILVALPAGNHKADVGADALAAAIPTLPKQLAKSLTWDQGHEMAEHRRFTAATGIQVYFCDPKSPWQRGSNEKHQRPPASIPAPTTRPPHADPDRPRRHRPRTQRTTSTDTRVQDTITSTRRSVR